MTGIFRLHDGTVVLSGYRQMIWRRVLMSAGRFPAVPRFFRIVSGVMRGFGLSFSKSAASCSAGLIVCLKQ